MKFLIELYKRLPSPIRGRITRRLYKIKDFELDDFSFRLAATYEERVKVMKLLHESYRNSGLSNEETELRLSKFNLLPTTHTFIVVDKETENIWTSPPNVDTFLV